MLFYVELHIFPFLFAASVYFLLESRGNVRLHDFCSNSYLCFPTAPEKERKEKKTSDVDVGKNLLLLNNESYSQTFYHRL